MAWPLCSPHKYIAEMVLSMTGFGSATAQCETRKYTFEIKSLNSKQLDLSLRIPQGYRALEADIRGAVAGRAERGKVELSMFVETVGGDAAVQLNVAALKAYKHQVEEVSRQLSIPLPADWYSVLLRFPDAVRSVAQSEISEAEREAVRDGVGRAVEALMEYRAVEGRKLTEFFRERTAAISELLAQVPKSET
ncbi:MAG: hypothetical protein K2O10_06845, partial [Muribaculaceae bacterium]|nr:hypothetical protein [Muribaculaceae bacterium]